MDGVAEGRYTLGFVHPVLDSLDLPVPVIQVDVAGGRRSAVMLFTPSPTTAYAKSTIQYASMCPRRRNSLKRMSEQPSTFTVLVTNITLPLGMESAKAPTRKASTTYEMVKKNFSSGVSHGGSLERLWRWSRRVDGSPADRLP